MPKIKEHIKKNGEKVYKFKVYTGTHPLTGKYTDTTRTYDKKKLKQN